MRRILAALAGLVSSVVLVGLASAAIVINFPNFANCSTLQLNGNAACTSNVLRVTPANFGQGGSTFSQTLVPLGPGNTFRTFFSFQITGNFGSDNDGSGADGITFTVQPNASTAGGAGGGIGYSGIPNSVAIEFDTSGTTASAPETRTATMSASTSADRSFRWQRRRSLPG